MTLRARIAVIAAGAVAVVIVLASIALYAATAHTLRSSVDRGLESQAAEFTDPGTSPALRRLLVEDFTAPPADELPPSSFGPRPGRMGGAGGFVQFITAQGRVLVPAGAQSDPLPVTDRAVAVAGGDADATFDTVDVAGQPVRVVTVPVAGDGLALQVARPLDEVTGALATLRQRLVLGGLAGIVLAAGLGVLAARRATRPVKELTELADDVATSGDLSRRITVERDDELGRLAATLNTMLANLEQARQAQQQLIADASHELRTPLTSLRTNVEVLADAQRLDPADRQRLISDVTDQLDELSRLLSDLIELAHGEQPVAANAAVRLDHIAAEAVELAAGRAHDPAVGLHTRPTTVRGDADRLRRAVVNLVDNAVKHGAAPVEVTVEAGRVEVRDHGPGIAEADLAAVFDRFYRAAAARAVTGSGLGLAIVAQIAASHGGQARAANHPQGGAVLTLAVPEAPQPATPASAGAPA